MALDKDLQQEEYLDFRQDVPISKFDYLETCLRKARLYLMKEDDSSIPAAKRKMVMLAILHYGLLALIWGTIAYFTFGYLQSTRIYKELVM